MRNQIYEIIRSGEFRIPFIIVCVVFLMIGFYKYKKRGEKASYYYAKGYLLILFALLISIVTDSLPPRSLPGLIGLTVRVVFLAIGLYNIFYLADKANKAEKAVSKKERKQNEGDEKIDGEAILGGYKRIKSFFLVIIILLSVILALGAYNAYIGYKEQARWHSGTYDKVMRYLNKKDYDGCLRYSEDILRESPGDHSALMGKAVALFSLGRLEEAKKVFLLLKEAAPYWDDYTEGHLKAIESRLKEEKS